MLFQSVGERSLDATELLLVDVQACVCFRALRTSLVLDAEVELGDDVAVVCPTLGATLSPCDRHVLPVPLPDVDIIDEMTVLIVRMHP